MKMRWNGKTERPTVLFPAPKREDGSNYTDKKKCMYDTGTLYENLGPESIVY